MSTPLELAHRVIANRLEHLQPCICIGCELRELAQALIESEKQREPVEVSPRKTLIGVSNGLMAYGVRGICRCMTELVKGQNFCPHCGHSLNWTKEKA